MRFHRARACVRQHLHSRFPSARDSSVSGRPPRRSPAPSVHRIHRRGVSARLQAPRLDLGPRSELRSRNHNGGWTGSRDLLLPEDPQSVRVARYRTPLDAQAFGRGGGRTGRALSKSRVAQIPTRVVHGHHYRSAQQVRRRDGVEGEICGSGGWNWESEGDGFRNDRVAARFVRSTSQPQSVLTSCSNRARSVGLHGNDLPFQDTALWIVEKDRSTRERISRPIRPPAGNLHP